MRKLRVLIVDDEPLIRSGIRTYLSKLDGVEIVGECQSGAEAIAGILSQEIDLVLLDVQMPDCTGLEVIQHVGAERMPMVTFITAYDEYAIEAFRLNAIDYLLKPFDEERFAQSIARARERLASQSQSTFIAHLQQLLHARPAQNARRLVVKNGESYGFVDTNAIDWVESANNYVQLHCGAKSFLMAETMSNLEGMLSKNGFVRIHRGRIVNTAKISAIHSMLNGTYEVELRSGVRLSSGKQYKDSIHQLLKPAM